jgi:hypothetical protein
MKFILILFTPLFCIAQNQPITGVIINKNTKDKISFASVSLLKQNTGINADENGRFSLPAKRLSGDTLVISSVGFYTLKMPIDSFTINKQFELIEKPQQLHEIIIKAATAKSSISLNDFSNCGINYYTTSNAVSQVAQHFKAPVANSILSDLYLCKLGDNSIFRIRVYSMDSILKIPDKDIADTIIEVRSGKRHVHIELEKYKIYLAEKDFFIAIEWIKTDYNIRIEKAYFNGIKTSYFQYSPSISYKANVQNSLSTENEPEVWQKEYTGKWIKFYTNARLLLSAKLKF